MIKKTQELPSAKEIPLLETIRMEKINFEFLKRKRVKRWYIFYRITFCITVVLCIALLLSEIGLGWIDFSDVGKGANKPAEPTTSEKIEGILLPTYKDQTDNTPSVPQTPNPPSQGETKPLTKDTLYAYDYSLVPQGEIPIVPMDLSLTSYSAKYIHNDTGHTPNTEALLKRDLSRKESIEYLSATKAPAVLIVHTHGTEAYSEDGAISYVEEEDLTRSVNIEKNVVSVGAVIGNYLNQQGISTVHCTVLHDQVQYKDSYSRAEQTIRTYLEKYPSIRLVIDVHRDSIMKSTGEMVRPVSLINGEAAAQLMCIVGSDWGGQENPRWNGNLALALQVREKLNLQYENLCRPVYLRSSTYNQEIAPYSLLVEVGSSGNSLEEAHRSALALARILVEFIPSL